MYHIHPNTTYTFFLKFLHKDNRCMSYSTLWLWVEKHAMCIETQDAISADMATSSTLQCMPNNAAAMQKMESE